ncbi:MAG: hypothetical protein K9L62_01985 [Vallitaleaceae bacterium]|nr:hypothetical protein [Vallitaleaceae bacterium]
MNDKTIRILTVVIGAASFGLNMLSNLVSEKQLNSKIKEVVNETLKNR